MQRCLRTPEVSRIACRHLYASWSACQGLKLQRTFATKQPPPHKDSQDQESKTASVDAVSNALRDAKSTENNLLAPIHIPEDEHGILNERHPATSILANSAIVVQRELEMMNLMLGFEQANKYVIMDPKGNHLGFMAEQEFGMGNMMARQWFRTHRSFTTHVFDRNMKEVLRFHRPFSWISSRIRVYDPLEATTHPYASPTSLQSRSPGPLSINTEQNPPQTSSLQLSDMRIIGEAQQQWAPLRRKYDMFLFRDENRQDPIGQQTKSPTSSTELQTDLRDTQSTGTYDQFAYVDERFLSWDFSLLSSSNKLIGSVNRNFAGFGREIFTNTGVYALRMDAAGLAEEPNHLISSTGASETIYGQSGGGMSLDQRAIMLATAVSIDFDYFSRQRGGAFGGMFPFWMGGAPAEGVAGAEATGAGAAGDAAVTESAGGLGKTASNVPGSGEGAMVGAGTMAGYEAMQRGIYGRGSDGSPTASGGNETGQNQYPGSGQSGEEAQEEVWGEEWPWDDSGKGRSDGGSSGDNGGGWSDDGGGGGDGGDWF